MANDYFVSKRVALSDGRSPSPGTPATPHTQLRNTALTAKVNSVLSASYADFEIKDALQLLDERGVKNTAETRRRLRLDIQKDVIESNGLVVQEFGHVAEQLKRIGTTIATLNESYALMRQHINAAHQDAAPVLDEASGLLARKSDVEKKQALLSAFRAHFIISEDDLATLTSTAEPVNANFFTILNRAKRIQSDCSVLIADEQNQRLGLEIMERISSSLDLAYQKLFRWTTREFKSLNLENPSLNARIREGLRVLAERPSLFQSCLDFFAEAREGTLNELFYVALTGVRGDGRREEGAKPIESVAHDSLRYVGDMLAWVHSATVSEREALEVLFIEEGEEISRKIQKGREEEHYYDESDGDDDEEVFDGRKALDQLVDRDVNSVARILKQRVEQVIQSLDDPVLVYKIADLVIFYHSTFTKLLGDDSELLAILQGLESNGMKQFRVLMSDKLTSISAEIAPDAIPTDLSEPDFLSDALRTLTQLAQTYDSSILAATSGAAGFKPVMAEAFDPYYDAISNMAAGLATPKKQIFTINCLSAFLSTLQLYQFTADRAKELQIEMDGYAAPLADYQYDFLVSHSGIAPLLAALRRKPGDEKPDPNEIAKLAPFQPENLEKASEQLDTWLPTALMDALNQVSELNSAALGREVTEQAVWRFVEGFEALEDVLLSVDVDDGGREARGTESEGEEEWEKRRGLTRWFARTGGEIRVLLT